MKTLEKDELYQNLQGFLKNKGVELKEGSYVRKLQKSCELLSDAINTSQQGLSRAKSEIDKKLDQLRQVIHAKTAPGGSNSASRPKTAQTGQKASGQSQASGKAAGKASRARKSSKPRRPRS